MKYTDVRDKIQSGDILAWTHRGWRSWYDFQVQMVRTFTQSEYCHIGVAWRVSGRIFVIEAVTPLVRIYPLSKELPFYWIPVSQKTPYWSAAIEETAMSLVGEQYSKWDAIKAGLNLLKNGENGTWECAEIAISLLAQANIVPYSLQATPSRVVFALQDLGHPVYLVGTQ